MWNRSRICLLRLLQFISKTNFWMLLDLKRFEPVKIVALFPGGSTLTTHQGWSKLWTKWSGTTSSVVQRWNLLKGKLASFRSDISLQQGCISSNDLAFSFARNTLYLFSKLWVIKSFDHFMALFKVEVFHKAVLPNEGINQQHNVVFVSFWTRVNFSKIS